MDEDELYVFAKQIQAPFSLVQVCLAPTNGFTLALSNYGSERVPHAILKPVLQICLCVLCLHCCFRSQWLK